MNAGRIVPEARPGSGRPLEDLAAASGRDHAHCRSSPVAVAQSPRDTPQGDNVPRLTASGARARRLVPHAPHLTSTSGSQIPVIIEPASRAELEPVIAAG